MTGSTPTRTVTVVELIGDPLDSTSGPTRTYFEIGGVTGSDIEEVVLELIDGSSVTVPTQNLGDDFGVRFFVASVDVEYPAAQFPVVRVAAT